MEGSRKGGKEREERKEGRNVKEKRSDEGRVKRLARLEQSSRTKPRTQPRTQAEDATAEARRRKLEELPHGPDLRQGGRVVSVSPGGVPR